MAESAHEKDMVPPTTEAYAIPTFSLQLLSSPHQFCMVCVGPNNAKNLVRMNLD